MTRSSAWILVLAFGLANSGCAVLLVGGAAAAGAGAVAYIQGELKSSESAPLGEVWSATQGAMKDLEFAITSREKDAISAKLIARGAGDRKVQIALECVSDTVTEIRIRVGVFGDEPLSRKVLEAIRQRLG